MRRSHLRTVGVIGGLSLALAAGIAFKQEVVPPTPLLLFAAGADPGTALPEHFTGKATIDTAFSGNGGARFAGARTVFAAGSRTHWHSHPRGQLLIVTAGRGWVQDRGGQRRALVAGDVVWTAPGVEHWHGAGRETLFAHVAVAEPDLRGNSVEWGEPVAAADYAGSASSAPSVASLAARSK